MKRKTLNRRDFLNGTLMSAAGVAAHSMMPGFPSMAGKAGLLGTMPGATGGLNPYQSCHQLMGGSMPDIPPASGELLDCVILGGGISGLSAAWKLLRMGLGNTLILEKNGRIGGQCRSIVNDAGLLASQGSAYASIPYTRVLTELYTDLGIVTGRTAGGLPIVADEFLLKQPGSRHYIEGRWYDDPWVSEASLDALPFPAEVRADFRELREIVEWWWDFEGTDGKPGFALPVSDASRDADVLWLDNQSLAEYLAYEGLDPRVSEFLDPLLRSVFCLKHDEVSAYVAVDFLTGEILEGDGEEEETVICQPGGNAFIAGRIAGLLGEKRIKTDAFVLRAVNHQDEVHISYMENNEVKTVRAATVIYSCPRMMAPYILPEMSSHPSSTIDFNYGAYLIANIHISETPSELGYANEVHHESSFTDFTVADWAGFADPSNAPSSRPNILTIYAPQDHYGARGQLISTPIEVFEEQILGDLERVLPGINDITLGFDLFRWGHPMVRTSPGFLFSSSRETAGVPLGRIFFGGHEAEGVPYIDTAITAGVRAAAEAASQLPLREPREPEGRSR